MKVLFDGQIFLEQPAGGISRYYTALATDLNTRPGVSARIIAPLHRNEILLASAKAPVFGVGLPDKRGVARLCRLVRRISAPVLDRLLTADIVHETYFSPEPHFKRTKRRVTTVYDMVHEIYYPNDPASRYKRDAVARCDHVICISNNTKHDLCELFKFPPERASVTHLTYEDFSRFAGGAMPQVLEGAPYFLHVGNRAGYKNFELLLRAFASAPQLTKDFRVICFGGGRLTDGERANAAKLGIRHDALVHLSGSDAVLGAAYAHAVAFVYPSLYEGFGIPPLEAMSASCPVVCTNSSSLPEVVGDAALMFDPKDSEALREALLRIATSEETRVNLVLRGHERRQRFTRENMVSQTLAVYRGIL